MELELELALEAPSHAVVLPKLSLKTAALAHFSALESPLRTLAERYRDVAFDVSTPKGLDAAKKARNELREHGRYAVQRAEEAFKTAANEAKKAVAPKVDELIAIIRPIEDQVDAQIKAREEQIAAEKAAEAERKAKHTEAIARIAAYVGMAHGKPAQKIAQGIELIEAIDVSEAAFEEYAPAAQKAKADTLAKLLALHAEALDTERVRAENQARERAIQAIARLNAHVAEGIGEDSHALVMRLTALRALAPQDDSTGEISTAYMTAVSQLEGMLEQANEREKLRDMLASLQAANKAGEILAAAVATTEPQTPAVEPETAFAVDSGTVGSPDHYEPSEAINAEAVPEVAPAAEPAQAIEPAPHVVQPSRDPKEAKRLADAAALAEQSGGYADLEGRWSFDTLTQIADLIDAAREGA